MRINYKQLLVVASAAVFTFVACSKDDDEPGVKPNSVVAVADLVGDTASKASPQTPKDTVYFSFKSNAKVTTGADKTTWDVAFTSLYNSYVSSSNGKVALIDSTFDQVTTAPSDDKFTYTSIGMETAGGLGWYTYSPATHTIGALNNRTVVLRTADGKYAKLKMVSIYKGNPAAPTTQTPLPYLTFSYYIQADGSKNLSTK